MEEATFLTRFAPKVTSSTAATSSAASKIMLERARRNPKIELVTDPSVDEILGDDEGRRACGCATRATSTQRRCREGLFVAIGHSPNSEAVPGGSTWTRRATSSCRDHAPTKIPGVFAAGDVADHATGRR